MRGAKRSRERRSRQEVVRGSDRGLRQAVLGKVARGKPEGLRKRRSWKEVFKDLIIGALQREV